MASKGKKAASSCSRHSSTSSPQGAYVVVSIHQITTLLLLIIINITNELLFNQYRLEQGEFFGIDLGGSNLRVMWVHLGAAPGEIIAQDVQEWPVPEECYDTGNGRLMNWVAERAEEVILRHPLKNNSKNRIDSDDDDKSGGAQDVVVGFCFSFACDQRSLSDGKLLLWTKSFKGSGLIGKDVVVALKEAFSVRGISVSIPALMNDTVATLVALSYTEPTTKAGIILGTGTNCAYVEKKKKIKKLLLSSPVDGKERKQQQQQGGGGDSGKKLLLSLPVDGEESKQQQGGGGDSGSGSDSSPSSMVVNTEWGDFAGTEVSILPRCEEDIWIDCASTNPGHGLLEKLIGGLYCGNVVRRILLKLMEYGGLFGGLRGGHGIGSLIANEGAFTTAAVAAIDQDTSVNLEVSRELLVSALGLDRRRVSFKDLQVVQEVCGMVARRSARLCAAGIAAVIEQCDDKFDDDGISDDDFVIAVDGSFFSKYPGYRVKLREALVEVMGVEAAERVRLELVENGSVAGAAFLAAAAAVVETSSV